MPEIVFVELDADLARTEPDAEIQDLIQRQRRAQPRARLPARLGRASTRSPWQPDAELASRIVWFDAFVTNVDRTPRNTNMLVWHRKLWLIDHGAALYFHHAWADYGAPRDERRSRRSSDHVLLPFASRRSAPPTPRWRARLTRERIAAIVALIPDDWLDDDPPFASNAAHRAAYADYLTQRLEAPRAFVEEAARARSLHV